MSMPSRKFQFSIKSLLGLMVVVALLGSCFRMIIDSHLQEGLDHACQQRLDVIRYLIKEYADRHSGMLPPSQQVNDGEMPNASWRALIIDCCEDPDFRQRYSYDYAEPWDGPHNSRLLGSVPRLFNCPRDSVGLRNGYTSYVAIVNDKKPSREILAVVECPVVHVPWFKPFDLTLSDALPFLEEASKKSPHFGHRLSILYCDGRIGNQTPKEILAGVTAISLRLEKPTMGDAYWRGGYGLRGPEAPLIQKEGKLWWEGECP